MASYLSLRSGAANPSLNVFTSSILTSTATGVTTLQGGNVGIGTSNPLQSYLSVFNGSTTYTNAPTVSIGDGAADQTATYGMVNLTRPATFDGKAHISFIRAGNMVHNIGYYSTTNTLAIGVGQMSTVNGIFLTQGTNVGIGTFNPQGKMDVRGNMMLGIPNGTSASSSYMIYANSSNGFNQGGSVGSMYGVTTGIKSGDLNTSAWNDSYTSGDCYVISGNIQDTGNNGTAAGTYRSGNVVIMTGQVSVLNSAGNTQTCIPGDIIMYTGNVTRSNPPAFTNGVSERMRITSGGNVGVGTTTPTQALHVNGTALAGLFTSQIQSVGAFSAINAFTMVLPYPASYIFSVNGNGGSINGGAGDTNTKAVIYVTIGPSGVLVINTVVSVGVQINSYTTSTQTLSYNIGYAGQTVNGGSTCTVSVLRLV